MSFASIALDAIGRDDVGRFRAARLLSPCVAILSLAVAVQMYLGLNTDTSWNITLVEKLLAGERPYIDFIEINPPASFLLCLAPTLAARFVGVTPEFMLDLFCFASAGASLGLTWIILKQGDVMSRNAEARLAVIAAIVLLLLPARAFGQREHIAVIACLPCIATLVVWASHGRLAPLLSVLAGVGAGVALAIKPHFVLFFLPVLIYLVRRAGWRVLVIHPEIYNALAVAALYWIAVFAWFPSFFDRAASMARDVYLPVRRPLAELLCDPTFVIWIVFGVLLALLARKRLLAPPVAVPALASLGAMAAFVIQGKLWPYQGYPAIAFATLALGPLVLEVLGAPRRAGDGPLRLAVPIVSILALALAGAWLGSGVDRPELERAVAAISPHPKLLAIGSDIAIGHPLTRRVGGVWVGSLAGLWVTDMSSYALDQNPVSEQARDRYEAYLRFDRETLVKDIVSKKPDVILVASDLWLAWARSHPDVAAALADYNLRATADNIMVYGRATTVGR
jgi:hypothetical protein